MNRRPDRIGTSNFDLVGTGGAIGVLYVNAYELRLAGQALRLGGKHRRLLTAGHTPGGPEVDDQWRPFQRSEADSIAVEGLDRKVGDAASNKRAGLLLRCM